MVILLDRKAFKPALPDVATASIKTMITADMTGHSPLHEGAQRLGGSGLNHQMKMIRHEAEGQKRDRKFGPGFAEEIGETPVILTVMENLGTAVTPVNNVVERSGFLSTGNAGHDGGQ
jgi:hypothetical protein